MAFQRRLFASRHGCDRLNRVPVVGRSNRDDIDIVTIKERAIVANGHHVFSELVLSPVKVRLENVSDADELALLVFRESIHQLRASKKKSTNLSVRALHFVRFELCFTV